MSRTYFREEEFEKRLARTIAAMEACSVDLYLVFHPSSICWLTGAAAKSYQSFQVLLVNGVNGSLTMLTREAEGVEFSQDARVDRLVTWSTLHGDDPLSSLGDLLPSGRVGMEMPAFYLSPAHAQAIGKLRPDVVELPSLVHDLRLVKSDAELRLIERAADIASLSMARFADGLKAGRREMDLAADVYASIFSSGASAPVVPINLVSGDRAAQSHGGPTERILKDGDTGNAEYCVPYRSYLSSIGRTFSLGSPPTRLAALHAAVSAAQDACIDALRPGTTAREVYLAATAEFEKRALTPMMVHTVGYSLATGFAPATGDQLQLTATNKYVLAEGMVLSICPNLFDPLAKLGARLVDNVLITAKGARRLTFFPSEMIVA